MGVAWVFLFRLLRLKMFFACQFLFTCGIALSFAIWATILLSQNGFSSGCSELIVAYMITDCIVNYMRAINCVTVLRKQINGQSGLDYVGGCLSLGMLIWNIVLLFRDVGIGRISENSYYMYIYVSFIVNMIAMGVAICAFFITMCCIGCAICNDIKHEQKTENKDLSPV